MMRHNANDLRRAEQVDACWSRIGVGGNRSCPKLAEAVHCRNCSVFSAAGQQLFDRQAPPEYLDQWTRQLAELDRAAVDEARSLLVFRVGAEWLSLDIGSVIEVAQPRRIHRVPHRTDRLLLGLANIRGELQLCISLRELLGIDPGAGDSPASTPAAGSRERLLVVERDHQRWVFPVDEVEGVHRVALSAMENLTQTVEKSPKYYTEAIFSLGDKPVGVLSVTRVFPTLERTVQ